jgi:hypothetical protein
MGHRVGDAPRIGTRTSWTYSVRETLLSDLSAFGQQLLKLCVSKVRILSLQLSNQLPLLRAFHKPLRRLMNGLAEHG